MYIIVIVYLSLSLYIYIYIERERAYIDIELGDNTLYKKGGELSWPRYEYNSWQ